MQRRGFGWQVGGVPITASADVVKIGAASAEEAIKRAERKRIDRCGRDAILHPSYASAQHVQRAGGGHCSIRTKGESKSQGRAVRARDLRRICVPAPLINKAAPL
jgi:hypothetical protein